MASSTFVPIAGIVSDSNSFLNAPKICWLLGSLQYRTIIISIFMIHLSILKIPKSFIPQTALLDIFQLNYSAFNPAINQQETSLVLSPFFVIFPNKSISALWPVHKYGFKIKGYIATFTILRASKPY
jgi:hypothetical protein